MHVSSPSAIARFWSKVDKAGPISEKAPGNCWNWTGSLAFGGKGKFWLDNETELAHRVAYALSNERLNPDDRVTQVCENDICCNPEHLALVPRVSKEVRRLRALETARAWKKANKPRCKELRASYYRRQQTDPDLKDLELLSKKQHYWNNRERILAKEAAQKLALPAEFLLKKAKERAVARNLEFTITADDIVIPKRCPLLGMELKPGDGAAVDSSPTIDRIDCSRGYTPDNIWVISYRANRIKNDASLAEMQQIAKRWAKRVKKQAEDSGQQTLWSSSQPSHP